jgi:tetratricopeptide (TPR) repeat protein
MRIDEADKAFEKLVAQFPNAKDLDRLFDEWAWMNVSAKRFERSDAIHKQMLEKFPDSPFAGQARLSLAESMLEAGKLDEALTEMEAINATTKYGAAEKERALFHVIELQAATRNWQAVVKAVDEFLANYAASPLAAQTRLFAGNAQVELQNSAEATRILTALRDEIVADKIPTQDWTDRVWVVLAESALSAKEYEKIDLLEAELKQRSAMSPFMFQVMDVQGRRWKQQAPPDFEKARKYFEQVTADTAGQGTETAARCQFLLAETLLLEMKLDDAVKEYFKVYLNYSYDELRVQALFQAATCEVRLEKKESAVRDFKELIATFPASPLAKQATEELVKLGVPGD